MSELVILTEEIQEKLMKCWEEKVLIVVFYNNGVINTTIEMEVEDVDILDSIEITGGDGVIKFSVDKSEILHIEKFEEVVSTDYELKLSNGSIIISFIN